MILILINILKKMLNFVLKNINHLKLMKYYVRNLINTIIKKIKKIIKMDVKDQKRML